MHSKADQPHRATRNPTRNKLKPFNHLSPREAQAITYYRQRMHMSISHIAQIIERSTRTVARLISKNRWLHKTWDMRHHPNLMKQRGESAFRRAYGMLTWFFSVWKDGLISNIELLGGKPP